MTDWGQFITDLLTELAKASIPVLVLALVGYLVKRYGSERVQRAYSIVQWAVYAAEQMYGPGAGATKLAQATTWIDSFGLKFTSDQIRMMIESAVLGTNLAVKELPPKIDAPTPVIAVPPGISPSAANVT